MKVAIVGVWHVHAPEYTDAAKKYGEVVGVYEENREWCEDFAKRMDIRAFESYDELLASDAEAIIVCTATNKHTEYIVKAANAGKHIFTEKVLALDTEGCEVIAEAVKKNGVKFVISFPWKFNAGIMAVKKAVDDGLVGKVNYVRFRNCHSGSTDHWLPAHFYNKEECGGGAMIDLGAHGMYLAHWILGEPDGYTSSFNHFCRDEKDAMLNPDGIEDNAITVMSYKNGAIAVNETGFVTVGCPETFEVGGENGYLVYNGGAASLRDRSGSRELPMPAPAPKPIEAFMKGETPDGCGLDEACALTRMMLGAYKNVK